MTTFAAATRSVLSCCFSCILLALVGCATARSPVDAYFENDYEAAVAGFKKQAAKQDKNFAMYAASLGATYLAAGDVHDANAAFMDASAVMNDLEEGKLRGLGSLIANESLKVFKGEPYERAMVDCYTGLTYYMRGDYENARVGFFRALKADKDSKDGFQDDFGLAHYLLGKAFLGLGQVEDAKLAFSKAARYAPANPYAALDKNRDANFTLILDLGRAPAKVEAGPMGSVDDFERAEYPERHATVLIDGQRVGRTAKIVDLYDQARTSGRSLKDVIQTAKGLSKFGAFIAAALLKDKESSYAALLFAILYPSWADTRKCELMPGEVHIFTDKLSPGLRTVTLRFNGAGPAGLDRYDQIWHYVPVQDGKETVLYCRSGPDKSVQFVQAAPTAQTTVKQ
ncbi:MAG: hypothetical protein FJ279_03660 [Planctomycetes bacterium]|nr:hypothetical protein [Planctomycetota bacterium]MBM4080033.1 hypothetical protein [Planctomycetota bacterium]